MRKFLLLFCFLMIFHSVPGFSDGDDVKELLSEGWSLQVNQKYDAALTLFKKALELAPNHAPVYSALGRVYRDLERYDEAVESYKKAGILNPRARHLDFELGKTYLEMGKFQEAIDAFKSAIGKDPEYWDAHFYLAESNKYIGRWEEAIKTYEIALEHMIWLELRISENLAYCHIALKEWEKAAEIYKKQLNSNSGYELLWVNLGVSYLEMGKIDEAIELYEKGLSAVPKSATLHYNHGVLSLMKGLSSKAEEEYKALKKLDKEKAQELEKMLEGKVTASKSQMIILYNSLYDERWKRRGKMEMVVIHPRPPDDKPYIPLVE